MGELGELLRNLGVPAAGGGIVYGLLWLASKWIERRKAPHEVLDDVLDSQRESMDHAAKRLHECEQNEAELRRLLKDKEIEAYRLYVAIQNFLIDYPHHTAWWRDKLEGIRP